MFFGSHPENIEEIAMLM